MTVRRGAAGCVALGITLLLAAVTLAVVLTREQVVTGAAGLPPAAGAVPTAGSATASARPVPPPSAGARLQLARLRLDAPVVPVRLRGRVMQVPRDPARVGWWRTGAVPGAARGSAVMVGHVNYGGTSGAFAVLAGARPGDRIVLTAPRLAFRVVAVRSYPKRSGLPRSAFAATGPAQLVLITCGGRFDPGSGNYEDNIAVYAVRS